MHDCKATREMLNDLAVSGESARLPDEVWHCEPCRDEYISLHSTLRITDEALQSAAPAENFWLGYHARLRERLERDSEVNAPTGFVQHGALTSLLGFLTGSVRVPIPMAAILLLAFGATLGSAVRWRRSPVIAPQTVITKTIEVPIVHEKTVTQVVYRNANPRAGAFRRANANLIAQRQSGAARVPIGLSGFTPINEVKLTIIKGSYRDDK